MFLYISSAVLISCDHKARTAQRKTASQKQMVSNIAREENGWTTII